MIRYMAAMVAVCFLAACATAPSQTSSQRLADFMHSARYQNWLRHVKQYNSMVAVSPVWQPMWQYTKPHDSLQGECAYQQIQTRNCSSTGMEMTSQWRQQWINAWKNMQDANHAPVSHTPVNYAPVKNSSGGRG